MSDELFSAGFAWGHVAPDATPSATRSPARSAATAAPLSQTAATSVATFGAPSFSRDFGWDADGVASVAGVAKGDVCREVSQLPIGARATPTATPETTDFRRFGTDCGADVAGVATVAEWARGIATLETISTPRGIGEREWRTLVSDAKATLTMWGADLIALGWSTTDVFGVNANMAHHRLDRLGLVALLDGRPIEAVDDLAATIPAGRGHHHTFRRDWIAAGGVALWKVQR